MRTLIARLFKPKSMGNVNEEDAANPAVQKEAEA